MTDDRFLKGAERLVDPVTAGSVHFLQQFFGMLPRRLQRPLLEKSSKAMPYMGFVVEPYAFFLFYRIADEQRAASLLPNGFHLTQARVFEEDEPACYAVVSLFRVHTSAFMGARAEFYLLAKDEKTGRLSWVIVDYLSDTVSYDRAHGLRAASAAHSVVTTSADGRVVVDLHDEDGARHVELDAALADARSRRLDPQLWVEGNLSIAYGPQLSPRDPAVFSLTFPPEEMAQALDVPLDSLTLTHMTWHDELLDKTPTRLVCFPFAQHVLSDSPGSSSGHASAADLRQAVDNVDFAKLRPLSTAGTKKAMVASTVVSLGIIAVLCMALKRKGRRCKRRS